VALAASSIKSSIFQRLSKTPFIKRTNFLDAMYDMPYRGEGKRGYKDYRKMMKDPQVKVGISILTLFLLSREIQVTSASDEPSDVAAAKFIEEALEDMEISMRKVRKNIYTALPYGFSASEVVYKVRADGKIGFKGFYSLHMKTLAHRDAFIYDDYGRELIGLQQKIDTEKIDIPIEKVLLYSFDQEFDEPEGNGLLDEIYDNFYIKNKLFKWLGIFLQKNESPFIVGKSSKPKYREKFGQQLGEVSEGRTHMLIGKEDEVMVVESQHRGEGFFNAIQLHDNIIFRRFFLGTLLLGQSNDASGSLAQSQTQFDVSKLLLDGAHEEMAEPLQQHCAALVDMNFINVKAPKISFTKFEDKDLIGLLNALKPYTDNLAIDPAAPWFKELVAQVVKDLSGVEVDKEHITGYEADDGDTAMETVEGDEDSNLAATLASMFP